MGRDYSHLSREELLGLLEARDRRDATKFGLVWEANEIDRDKALNDDFVALDLVPAESEGDAPWKNLIIEGDNFDALRYLKMTFGGRVKCIYIDPPYNTGNKDFVYNDHFVEKEDLWRHSTWCEFMYQRLSLAKDLLREDGVIFVSIDDNELFHLGGLLNKVFGFNSFISNLIWHKRVSPANDAQHFSTDHDYILCYALNPDIWRPLRQPHNDEQLKNYSNPDNDHRGAWNSSAYTCAKTSQERPNLYYPITQPTTGELIFPSHSRVWAYDKNTHSYHTNENLIYWGKDGLSKHPRLKKFLSNAKPVVPRTIWGFDDAGHNAEANLELRNILDKTHFSTPKPTRLIDRILQIATNPDDLILDFFAGSGTTAHSVLKANKADGGNRRFILVSSTEATDENPDKNLCRDVCAERVRRVIKGYKNAKGDEVEGLGGDFAYLRTRKIHPAHILDIEHEQVWTALQFIHRSRLVPYTDAPFLIAEGEGETTVIYIPRYEASQLPKLREAVQRNSSVIVYSWQAGLLREKLKAEHVQHENIPESLMRRFGLRIS